MTPYSESYTLSIQREVARDTLLSASYVGTQAHHLLVLISANPGNAALCLSLSRPQDVMPGTATCGPFGESGTYITASGQTIQGTRRAVQFPVRGGHLSEDHRQFQLQLARSLSPSCQFVAGTSAGLHLWQIARPVFQSGGSSQSARSRA